MSNQNNDNRILPVYLNPDDPGSFDNRHSDSLFPDALGKIMDEHAKEHADFINNNRRLIENRERSIADKRARDMQKKKQFKKKVTVALVTVATIAALGGTYAVIEHITNNTGITISEADKKMLDDKINFYYNKADRIMSNDISTDYNNERIENREEIVNYLLEAASVSDLEFRCALLGTAKKVGSSDFNIILNSVLRKATTNRDGYPNHSSLLFSGTTDNFYSNLGYKNYTEYWENERKAIYKLYLDKGLSPEEAEVAAMFATGDIDYEYFNTNSNGRGGK